MKGAWLLAVALAATFAACDKASTQRERLAKLDLLHDLSDAARSASCARLTKNTANTLPVPAPPSDKGNLVVGFYEPVGAPETPDATDPKAIASFPPGRGHDALCRIVTSDGASRGPRMPAGLTEADYLAAQADYYEALPAATTAYFERRTSAPSGYLSAFKRAAEPGLHPAYYRMNPDFWEWLRKAGGDSLQKPETIASKP